MQKMRDGFPLAKETFPCKLTGREVPQGREPPMIELIFVTCMSFAPSNCQERSLLFTDEVNLMTCMLHGQAEMARWIETHPSETVQSWKCRAPRSDGLAI